MQTLNDQLREKNTVLTKEAKEQKMEQEKKLAAANARLQQSKGNDSGAAKKAEELQRAMEAGEGYLLDEADMDVMTSTKHHGVRLKWHKRKSTKRGWKVFACKSAKLWTSALNGTGMFWTSSTS